MMIHKENLKKRYDTLSAPVKASSWFVICNIIQKSMYFIMIPVYTRLMNTEQYGIYSVFTSWVTLIINFAGLNLAGNSYNVGMIKYGDDRERYTSSMQGLWWANTTIWFVALFFMKDLWIKYTSLSVSFLVAVFIDIYATGGYDIWCSRQKFDYKYKSMVAITVAIALITPIVSIIIVTLSEDKAVAAVWCKVGIFFIFSLITSGVTFYRGRTFFDARYWKNALLFNIPLIAYYLSLTVLNQSDRIMINSISGTDKAGIYSIAYSFAMLLTILNSAVGSSFTPWKFKNIKAGKIDKIKKVSNLILIFIGCANILLIAVAPEIIYLFTTPDYYEAIWVIPPVALSAYLMCLYQFFVDIEFYYEKNKFVMFASIAVAILNIILNKIMIPIFGFVAAAYTTLISYFIFTIIHYLCMKIICKNIKQNTDYYSEKDFLIITIGIFILAFILMMLYQISVMRYLVLMFFLVVAGIICYKKKDKYLKLK